MEDIFERCRDREEAVFRYPLYERALWLFAVAGLAATYLGRGPLLTRFAGDARLYWAALGIIAFFALLCLWISFRAWESKIIISPTALRAKYLFQGIERISWDHIARVIYKRRLLGHGLVFVGTDGSKVRFRSSLSGYDRLVRFIRANAPEHILDQLDDLIGEEEEETEEPAEEKPREGTEPKAGARTHKPPRNGTEQDAEDDDENQGDEKEGRK